MTEPRGLTRRQEVIKRTLDVAVAFGILTLVGWVIVLAVAAATIDTRRWGIYRQERIGRWGQPFTLLKVRTMRDRVGVSTTITTSRDPRITPMGRWLRAKKLDEYPQLVNVLRGDMSLVGPRPDVAGWADRLGGEDRIILSVRPGITGPASLTYGDEEQVLARVADPDRYNRDVIWPDKVRINREYVLHYSLRQDLACLHDTVRRSRCGKGVPVRRRTVRRWARGDPWNR